MEYPADIVNKAIQNVSRETTFWPAYAEFYKHIGWKIKKRMKLLEALTAKNLRFYNKNSSLYEGEQLWTDLDLLAAAAMLVVLWQETGTLFG